MTLPKPTAPPICPACSKPIISGSLVLFQDGELLHIRCATEALGMKIAETGARSREAMTQAGEAKGRAVRLKAIARTARRTAEAQRKRSGERRARRRD